MQRFDVLSRIHQLQDIIQSHPNSVSSVPDKNYIFNLKGNADTEHLATLYFVHLDLVKSGIFSLIEEHQNANTSPPIHFNVVLPSNPLLSPCLFSVNIPASPLFCAICSRIDLVPYPPTPRPSLLPHCRFCIAHTLLSYPNTPITHRKKSPGRIRICFRISIAHRLYLTYIPNPKNET